MNTLESSVVEALSKYALVDRVAIVTGSGGGIGKGIALGFARVGAHVVVAELDAPKGEATAKEIRALGRKALAMPVNVTDSRDVAGMVSKVMAEFGRIDVLVNNVGGTLKTHLPTRYIDEDVWDKVIALNLKSTYLCSKAVSEIMIGQQRGNIVNIASDAALRAFPEMAAYGAAKSGVVNLTQTLAVELAQYGIRVNAIAPSKIDVGTPTYLAHVGNVHERARKAGILLGAGKTEDIAYAAIYLASDASNYVTGITLEVLGGPLFGGQILSYAEEGWTQKPPKPKG